MCGLKGDCRVRLRLDPDGSPRSVETQAVHPDEPRRYFPPKSEPSVEVAVGRAMLGGLRLDDPEDDAGPALKLFSPAGAS